MNSSSNSFLLIPQSFSCLCDSNKWDLAIQYIQPLLLHTTQISLPQVLCVKTICDKIYDRCSYELTFMSALDDRDHLISAGAVSWLSSVLNVYKRFDAVLSRALAALNAMAANHGGRLEIHSQGVTEQVMKHIESYYKKRQSDTLGEALSFLRGMFLHKQIVDEISSENIYVILFNILKDSIIRNDIWISACRTLSLLVKMGDKKVQDQFSRDVIPLVVNKLGSEKESVALNVCIVGVLAGYCDWAEYDHSIEILLKVASVLEENLDNQELIQEGLWILYRERLENRKWEKITADTGEERGTSGVSRCSKYGKANLKFTGYEDRNKSNKINRALEQVETKKQVTKKEILWKKENVKRLIEILERISASSGLVLAEQCITRYRKYSISSDCSSEISEYVSNNDAKILQAVGDKNECFLKELPDRTSRKRERDESEVIARRRSRILTTPTKTYNVWGREEEI